MFILTHRNTEVKSFCLRKSIISSGCLMLLSYRLDNASTQNVRGYASKNSRVAGNEGSTEYPRHDVLHNITRVHASIRAEPNVEADRQLNGVHTSTSSQDSAKGTASKPRETELTQGDQEPPGDFCGLRVHPPASQPQTPLLP